MSKERKVRIDPRALVARLSQQSQELSQREIIAPLLPGGRIRTRVAGMVYEFKLRGNFVGWGRFRPLNEREAQPLGEAQPWERGGYLEVFPVLRMLLLWPDNDARRPGTWWAIPFNESDAQQRFGLSYEPVPVFLCDAMNGAERFERVIVRVDGKTLWYDGPDVLSDPQHAEWLRDATAREDDENTTKLEFLPGLAGSERRALLLWQLRQLELSSQQAATNPNQQLPASRHEQRNWLHTQRQRNTLEGRLRYALQKADATLLSFSEVNDRQGSPGHIVVEWREHGSTYRYRSTISSDLTVISSGICLSDRDSDFDLTSLVNVMADPQY
jgi:hypothetical protein